MPTGDELSLVYQVYNNANLIVASSWVVLSFFCISQLVGDRQKNLQAFSIILVAAVPVLLVNAGWWAVSVLVFYTFYQMAVVFQRLFSGK